MVKNGIVFVPDSGNQYREFQRESEHAARAFGAKVYAFPASRPAAERRAFVLRILAEQEPHSLDLIAFLCHGYRTGIQAGFDLDTADELAAAIVAASRPGVCVPLYCCSTGKGPGVDKDGEGEAVGPGEGSFADDLRDGLVARGQRGGRMFCHTTAGHLSRNPDARVYEIREGEAGGLDVCPLYPPLPTGVKRTDAMRRSARDAYRRWRGFLHTANGRWELARMAHAEIVAAAMKCEPYA